MNLTEYHGYGPYCWVTDTKSYNEITQWLRQQDIDYWHVMSNTAGQDAFQLRSYRADFGMHYTLFKLKWLTYEVNNI